MNSCGDFICYYTSDHNIKYGQIRSFIMVNCVLKARINLRHQHPIERLPILHPPSGIPVLKFFLDPYYGMTTSEHFGILIIHLVEYIYKLEIYQENYENN